MLDKDFILGRGNSLSLHLDWLWGPPTLLPMGTRDLYPRAKAVRALS